jgi:uncharacterized metal-binding protein
MTRRPHCSRFTSMKNTTFTLNVTETTAVCPIGETVGRRNAENRAIPVMSCEGACIRGEIARLAANRVAKVPGYARACHGELFAVPGSEMARWVGQAEQVVVIDGCHLKCHGRIVENIVGKERMRSFAALARYRKYGDLFEIDAVPEPERRAVSEDVAVGVLKNLRQPATAARGATEASPPGGGCGSCS